VNLNKRLKQKDNAILVINITLGKSIKKNLKSICVKIRSLRYYYIQKMFRIYQNDTRNKYAYNYVS
jgi:hypothetical protein